MNFGRIRTGSRQVRDEFETGSTNFGASFVVVAAAGAPSTAALGPHRRDDDDEERDRKNCRKYIGSVGIPCEFWTFEDFGLGFDRGCDLGSDL